MIKSDTISAHHLQGLDTDINRYDMGLTEKMPFLTRHWIINTPSPVSFDMHYALEMGIILKGEVKRVYADKWAGTYGPGQIWFNGIWDLHGWQSVKTPIDTAFIYILPDAISSLSFPESGLNLLAPFFTEPHQRPRVPDSKLRQFCRLGQKLADIHASDSPLKQLWCRLIFMEILLHVYEFWTPPAQTSPINTTAFSKIQSAINLTFTTQREIPLKEAAAVCRMSVSAFTSFFKKITGLSFSEFNLRHRIKGIAGALLATEKPVKEIAYDWGFRYIGNMSRCFTKFYGCSPAQYRKNQKYG